MSKGNILVAGGAGYVGSHFCKAAAEHGYTPIVLDRLTSSHARVEAFRKKAVQWGPLEIADIGDGESVVAIARHYKPVAAVCFAALIEVAESITHPDRYWDNNFYRAARFFAALEKGGVEHLVFSSTAAIYGNPATPAPLAESAAPSPINPYGMTKLACEALLQGLWLRQDASDAFVEAYTQHVMRLDLTYPEFKSTQFPSLKNVIFRYFNAAGAATDADIGEMHEPETHLIPNALLAAAGARGFGKDGKVFTMHGDDYPTADGTCIRDFVHVSDLAEAHIAGLAYLLNGGENDVFNLGSGHGASVQQVVEQVKKVSGKNFPVHVGPRRAGDPALLVADTSKVREQLGWAPQHDLASIIASAHAFHQRHG